MANQSAGLLMYRLVEGQIQVLLVHPGGPFWANKDVGAWSIPKGGVVKGEQIFEAAVREFKEETGLDVAAQNPPGGYLPLGSIRLKSGKTVFGWAFAGDCDPAALHSNTFTLEWPPHSGSQGEYPEADKGDFFTLPIARQKIHPAQIPLLDALEHHLIQQDGGNPTTES